MINRLGMGIRQDFDLGASGAKASVAGCAAVETATDKAG
jgi:hypothetical protein